MNFLVFLDAGELEKILSGIKRMILKACDPSQVDTHPVRPGDSLYFVRDQDEGSLRVKASVVRVLDVMDDFDEALSRTLKEMQPRLQLTEEQYYYWSTKPQVILVEFEAAHKIDVIQVAGQKITPRSDWIPFEELSLIT